jgi:hypothetical protein
VDAAMRRHPLPAPPDFQSGAAFKKVEDFIRSSVDVIEGDDLGAFIKSGAGRSAASCWHKYRG